MNRMTCSDDVLLSSPRSSAPAPFESLCEELGHAGQKHLENIASLIEHSAPSPGRVVYLHTLKLPMQLGRLQPILFSAIDTATHLQVAQANLAMTSAAALSFVEFMAHIFPFPISEIKTRKEKPFHNPNDHRPHRDFVTLVEEQGYVHSFVENHGGDDLFSITSKMLFKGLSSGRACPSSAYELQRDLDQFLFFHNNFRFVPWMKGKTPIQKLRMFAGFECVHSFSPRDDFERSRVPSAIGIPDSSDLRRLQDNECCTAHIESVVNGEKQ